MHKHPSSWFVAVLTLAVCVSIASPALRAEEQPLPSPAEAAREVFDALQAGDKEAYASLLPAAEALKALLTGALAELEGDERKQAEAKFARRGGLDAMIAGVRAKGLARFERARERSSKAFDWKDARYVGVDASRQRQGRDGPLVVLQVHFLVRAGRDLHEFGANDAMWVEGRWVFPEGIAYKGRVGARTRDELMDLELLNESLEAEIRAMRDEIARLQREFRERDEQNRRREQDVRDHVRREQDEILRELDQKRKDAEEALEKARRHWEEQSEAKAYELRDLRAKHESDLAEQTVKREIAELERDHAKGWVEDLEERLQDEQDRWRRLEFAFESFEPVILQAFDHADASVRLAAILLAQEFELPGARPHFEKVFRDAEAPVDVRLAAAWFLADAGAPESLADTLKRMLRDGVGAGEGEEEAWRRKSLIELLDRAGVGKDEIERLTKEGAQAAKQR